MLDSRTWAVLCAVALLLPAGASLSAGLEPLPAAGPDLVAAQRALATSLRRAADAHDGAPAEQALAAADVALAQRARWLGSVVPAAAGPLLAQEQRNLATTRALLGLAAEPSDDLAQGVAAAHLASAWQAHALGLDLRASSPHRSPTPSAALEALATQRGIPLDATARSQLAAIDATPEPLRGALTDLVAAFDDLDAASQRAFAHADVQALLAFAEHPPSPEALASAAAPDPGSALRSVGLDLGGVLPARDRFLDAALAFQRATRGSAPPPGTGQLDIPPLVALDLTGADSAYTHDYVLLVDVGGNDFYHNNAGGNGLRLPMDELGLGQFQDPCKVPPTMDPPDVGVHGAAALLDLSGDDVYGVLADERGCGLNGGAWLGAAMLVDAAGDDQYLAGRGDEADVQNGSMGVNGGGFGGLGFLLDEHGDDTYIAGHHGTNGGGLYGPGLLLDMEGVDSYFSGPINFEGYTISSFSGNGGGFLGTGFLVDMAGADVYDAGSFGGNGGGFDGYGFLVDAGGDDRYLGLSSGSNGGANHGSGFIFDAAGDDAYVADKEGANGGGYLPPGVGMLIDAAGNDVFRANQRGTNGGADDPGGLGFLLDLGGNDAYISTYRATNGGASEGGVGLLFDRAGDDTYQAQGKGVNGGGWVALALAGVGMLFDGGGTDTYADESLDPPCTDCTVVPKDAAGAMLDSDSVAQTMLDKLLGP